MNVTVNQPQQLFVVAAGCGVSTLGFEVVFQQLKQLVARLDLPIAVREDEKGTVGQYADYRRALAKAEQANLKETWFHLGTPVEVRRMLERYRKSGDAIRIFYGDAETGRDWLEENDVVGFIARSCGTLKVPILLKHGSEAWGDTILDQCIVKLMDVASRKTLWAHPKYKAPTLQIVAERHGIYTHAALVDGELHARFASYGKAAQWVAFMASECMEQPT